MFSKKKEVKRRPRPAGSLAQYGIFEVPESIEDIGKTHGMDDGDEDLEAELAALTTGGDAGRRPRKNVKRIPDAELNAMINNSLKDLNSDEELSGDENDPALLDELQMITGEEIAPESSETEHSPEPPAETVSDVAAEETIKLLEERLTLYTTAEEKARNENSTSKVRRYGRGVKTLKEMLASAKSGRQVDTADIPPVLPPSATSTVTEKPPAPEPSESDPATPMEENSVAEAPSELIPSTSSAAEVDQGTLDLLKKRQQEYRIATVAWKKAGNTEKAIQHVKLVKQFDLVIAAIAAGNVVDLADIPGSPTMPETTTLVPSSPQKEESEAQQATEAEEESPPQPHEPLTGSSLESALKERLEIYRRTKVAAEGEGNTSKARRYGRICKQFEDALKMHTRGKSVPLDELPTPPGFPPLAVSTPAPPEPTPSSPPKPEPSPKEEPKKAPVSPPRANPDKKQKMITSRADKQMMQLQQRQQEFKLAALKAKKEGDLELARDYLRQAKGLDPLIDASKSGLPVDMNSIPLSPDAKMKLTASGLESKADDTFDLISKEDCLEEATGTDDQIYENLEAQLLKQIKWCLSTRDHCKALGDVPGYNRWERLALGYTRDLDMLRVRKRNGSPPPQHHYEIKTYAIVQSCTDLNDGDIELSIIRGINYPKETDTYVIFEFPYPVDSHMTDSTSTIRDTNNPEYGAVFPLNGIIERSSRQCQRTFKRHSLKCQVWSKGCSLNPILCCTHPRGFFKRDSLLGIASVKLQPLETKCILHDSFPLMDGRRATGGKLEVKLRLRNPMLTKQIDQITDKWLAIDH